MEDQAQQAQKNIRLFLGVLGTVFMMIGVTYAAVPLYSMFCQATGYAGTIKRTETAASHILDRKVTIRFNADTAANLPWKFKPEQRQINIKVGEQALISYSAKNTSAKPVSGTATFNVTPLKAGKYFSKIECFCFTEQTLQPGKEVIMPVLFYIDPAIDDDPNLDDIKTITLSYTFFRIDPDDDVSAIN